ncbi:MAG: hypothetical protein Q9195_003525 [Heterodermia aff. obscurata]
MVVHRKLSYEESRSRMADDAGKGPIVRINPHELSINDPDFYNELYVFESRRRTDGYHGFVEGLGIQGSHVLTTPHDLHRLRRKPLEPFFSRSGISRSWPDIAEVVESFARRIESLKGTGVVIRFDHAGSALAGDVIGRICWNKEKRLLDDPDFTPEWWVLL